MKKIIALMMLMLALVACKDQVQQVSGSYSYKISGKATMLGVEGMLTEEIGTMDIIHRTADSALITFNALRGPAYYTTAKITGKQVELESFSRGVTQTATTHDVMVSGTGTIYGEQIIFNLSYSGSTLNATNLTMLCKKN